VINPANPNNTYTVPSVSITTAHNGASSKASAGDARQTVSQNVD
jgi:hypothetical protein